MTFHNLNRVCLDCRRTGRRDGRCPECRKPMIRLSPRTRIPKRKDVKGWKDLKRRIQNARRREQARAWRDRFIDPKPWY